MTDHRSSSDTTIAERLLDRANAHDRMALGNTQYLGYFSFGDAKLMHDAAAALRGLAQTEQEPVAWRWKDLRFGADSSWIYFGNEPKYSNIISEALYAAPQPAGHAYAVADRREDVAAVFREYISKLDDDRAINLLQDIAHDVNDALSSASSTDREYDPDVAPCDDAEFGMRP
jgi:hypothetical protein